MQSCRDRKGKLQVVSTKLALGVLSSSKLSELYKYIYTLCSDYNNTVTRFRLQNMLQNFTNIMCFLHEDMSFGQHLIQSAVEDCFKDVSAFFRDENDDISCNFYIYSHQEQLELRNELFCLGLKKVHKF